MSKITTHIDGEELKVANGFVLNDGEILLSDADQLGDLKKVRVVIEPSLLRYWIEECDLLGQLGIEGTIW